MKRNDSMSIIVHDFAVVGPIPAANISLAKGLAAERARQVMEDPESPYYLPKICDCKTHEEEGEAATSEEVEESEETKKLDDETEAGFAALARAVLAEVQPPEAELTNGDSAHEPRADEDDNDIDGIPIANEDDMVID